MATKRQQAYQDVLNRTPFTIDMEGKVSELFGKNVFHIEVMREYLPSDAFKSMVESIQNGTRLDRKMADQVASAMKDWAITKGATHYTHWFQPLTGATAEKHDAFFKPVGPGKRLNDSMEIYWYNKNQMRHPSRMEELEIPSKHADIRHGIRLHQHSL